MCYPCSSSQQEKSQLPTTLTGRLVGCHGLNAENVMNVPLPWDVTALVSRRGCSKASLWQEVMCEADMAETVWFLLTTSAYPPQATVLSAPQPSLVPICKPNAEHYKLFRDWSCVSACNRPEECSKGYKPATPKKNQIKFYLHIRIEYSSDIHALPSNLIKGILCQEENISF